MMLDFTGAMMVSYIYPLRGFPGSKKDGHYSWTEEVATTCIGEKQ
jgi:hypothetical protein